MDTTVTQTQRDEKLEARAQALADGLRRLASLVEKLGDEALIYDYEFTLGYANMPVDDKDALAAHIRAGLDAGAEIEKSYSDAYAGAYLKFGPVAVRPYAARDLVCERVVTGTQEVTEEVADPEALAAVPKVSVTRTVDVVEWRCDGFLKPAPKAAAR
jgi:hypothetical protein